jgi:hypothetical protein
VLFPFYQERIRIHHKDWNANEYYFGTTTAIKKSTKIFNVVESFQCFSLMIVINSTIKRPRYFLPLLLKALES